MSDTPSGLEPWLLESQKILNLQYVQELPGMGRALMLCFPKVMNTQYFPPYKLAGILLLRNISSRSV